MTSSLERWLVVIPARLDSERLPRKPLLDLGGQPLIVRVLENLLPLETLGAHCIVATDSQEIYDSVTQQGFKAELTDKSHQSGTDRCAEVANRHQEFKYILNVQGDEPFLSTSDLKMLMSNVEEDPSCEIATMGWLNHDANEFKDPNIVKVVVAKNDQALFFSRSPIPYDRRADHRNKEFLQHLGVYAFQAKSLAQFCKLSEGSLESIEKLEQLRALEHGMSIKLVRASCRSLGIDTQSDLEAAREKISNPM